MRRLLLCLSLLLVFGCEEDPADPSQEQTIDFPDSTPDELVASLAEILNEMDDASYVESLASDFRFEFSSVDIDASGTPNGIWDRQRDVDAMGRMLTGEASRLGAVVTSIELTLWPTSESWQVSGEPDLFGLLYRRFELVARVTMADTQIYAVRSEQQLFVVETDEGFRIIHWRELGVSKSALAPGFATWGVMKAAY